MFAPNAATVCAFAAGGPFYNLDIASAWGLSSADAARTNQTTSAPISRESSVALVSLNRSAFSRCASAAAQNSPTAAFQFAITVNSSAPRSSYSVRTSQSTSVCCFFLAARTERTTYFANRNYSSRHCFYQPGSKSHFQLIFHADPVQSWRHIVRRKWVLAV